MQDYKQIDIEIANREKEIERYKNERELLLAERAKIAEAELAEAVAKVNALGGYATVEPPKKTAARAPSTGPKKYRDPVSGAEWSGQGSEPKWFSSQDKDQFLNPAWLTSKQAKSTKKNKNSQSEGASESPLKANLSTNNADDSNPMHSIVATSDPSIPTLVIKSPDTSAILNPTKMDGQLINHADPLNAPVSPSAD